MGLEAACRQIQIHHVRFVLRFALLQNPPLILCVRFCVSLHAHVNALEHA
jgi:hypothetical protein